MLEEAVTLARERGLPETWLNSRAAAWMPPIPQASWTDPMVRVCG